TGVGNEMVRQLREIDERLRLIEPCTKVQYLNEQIEELKQYMESADIADIEKEAIGEKLSSLIDTRNNMHNACDALKKNEECRNAFLLRQRVQKTVQAVQDGSVSAIRARTEITAIADDFARYELACFRQIAQEVEDHPCMAAQSLRIEIEKLSETGESPDSLNALIQKTKELEQECRNMQELTPNNRPDNAGDIARMVGELEIKKHLLMMDDSLSQEQKTARVGDIEMQKADLIRQAVRTQSKARISATVRTKFSPGKVNIEGEDILTDNAVIDVSTDDGDMSVNIRADEVELQSRKVKLRTKLELDFENGLLKLNGKAIKLPDELVDVLKASTAELELTEENGTAIYAGSAQKQFRLFAIIPINANVKLKANAETGQVMSMEKPWWTVFAID
ncbi:MAG: hypothetical protein GOU99_00675, partial [Candidatus Altiarchaeota archaeon]|nr:hypothetical protein [Candidatus Altiarchaeota archaeon]